VKSAAVALIIGLGFLACAQKRTESLPPQDVHFSVDSSLIAAPIIDTALGVGFSPPKGWRALSPNLLRNAQRTAIRSLRESRLESPEGTPQILYAWTDTLSGSVITVARFPGFDARDSSTTLREFERYHRSAAPRADVKGAVFYSNDFKVHQLLASDDQSVLFKMVFSATQLKCPVEFDFAVPKALYPQFIKTIESVAGSVEIYPINKPTN